jgi:hypothetical protein
MVGAGSVAQLDLETVGHFAQHGFGQEGRPQWMGGLGRLASGRGGDTARRAGEQNQEGEPVGHGRAALSRIARAASATCPSGML